MTDYAAYVILPKIYEKIQQLAPNVSLKILNHHEFSPEDFESEKLELAIGLEKKCAKPLVSERLFEDRPVCVAHKNHPIFKRPLTLKHYLQADHLNTCIYSEGLSRADRALKKLNVERKVKLTLPNALPAFQMLATSQLIGTFSRNIVLQAEQQYSLKHVAPPFAIPAFNIAQVWHRQQANDSGLIWLRTLIKEVAEHHFSNLD